LYSARGLGSGDREFQRLGLPTDLRERAARMEEGLEIVDRLWAGESISATAGTLELRGVRIAPRPVQRPRIPVWLAAGWPRLKPLRRAARWDGVYLMTNNQATDERLRPDEVAKAAEVVRGQRGTLDGFDIAANVDTLQEADEGRTINTAMSAAGATWTLELTPDDLAEHRRLIRRGPVR
jgi:alkanesulfonate monooxygenase SsuD/methylene tetrahydromethanopterin reductase-like flavin-dependent oxidoreductase (luciferase family)